MAKRKRVGFSRQHLGLDEIGRHHLDVEASIRSYFIFGNIRSAARFAGYTSEEVQQKMKFLFEEQDRTVSMNLPATLEAAFRMDFLQRCSRFADYTSEKIQQEMKSLLEEQDRIASMNLLAALEAAFRMDFLQRCYKRRKDRVSREFRELYDRKGIYVSLEEDIFQVWKQKSSVSSSIISDLKGAFKYRHWLAHGRYWVPKFGRYDYHDIYTLAETIFNNFPFEIAPAKRERSSAPTSQRRYLIASLSRELDA